MTEKRREATAVAAIKTRMISRNRPLVLRPVSPLKKELPTLAAMVELGCGIGLTAVTLCQGTGKFASGHLSFTTQTTRTGWHARQCPETPTPDELFGKVRSTSASPSISPANHNHFAWISCCSSNAESLLRLWQKMADLREFIHKDTEEASFYASTKITRSSTKRRTLM
jgi:hypothetical protein